MKVSDLTWNTEVLESVNHVTIEILDCSENPRQKILKSKASQN